MRDIELKQIGTIVGLPLYVDVAHLPNKVENGQALSVKDHQVILARSMLDRSFRVRLNRQEEITSIGLSTRATNAIINNGVFTKQGLYEAYHSGAYLKFQGAGAITQGEIFDWANSYWMNSSK